MTARSQSDPVVSVDAATCDITEPCNIGCCDDHPTSGTSSGARNWKAVLFGVLCLVGCLAGPLLAGGMATAAGYISGEAGIGLLIAATVIAVAVIRRSRNGKPIC